MKHAYIEVKHYLLSLISGLVLNSSKCKTLI